MGFQQLITKLTGPTWPDAKPLPQHVRAVRLDHKLLLHMEGAMKPSDRVETGYGKKAVQ